MEQKPYVREKDEVFVCECNSYEHQFIFLYDEEDNELFLSVHLSTYLNFWKRLWYAAKYVFGYKSRFGEFDNTIVRYEDLNRLKEYANKVKSPEDHIKWVNRDVNKKPAAQNWSPTNT